MMSDDKINDLTSAAELIYKFCDSVKGFYGGKKRDADTGRVYEVWNHYSGCKLEIENKLRRQLSKAEITILALAVGYGPTPCLTQDMRDEAMHTLWDRVPEKARAGYYKKMMDVLVSFY